MLSSIFGLTILSSIPKVQKINKKYVALAATIFLGFSFIQLKRNKKSEKPRVKQPKGEQFPPICHDPYLCRKHYEKNIIYNNPDQREEWLRLS